MEIKLKDIRKIIQDGFSYYYYNESNPEKSSSIYNSYEKIRKYENYIVKDIYSDCGVMVVLGEEKEK